MENIRIVPHYPLRSEGERYYSLYLSDGTGYILWDSDLDKDMRACLTRRFIELIEDAKI